MKETTFKLIGALSLAGACFWGGYEVGQKSGCDFDHNPKAEPNVKFTIETNPARKNPPTNEFTRTNTDPQRAAVVGAKTRFLTHGWPDTETGRREDGVVVWRLTPEATISKE